jgi:hypothetical protein
MSVLQTSIRERRYHGQQALHRRQGEPTGGGRTRYACQTGSGDGNETLDARMEPDEAGSTDVLLDHDADKR